MTEHSLPPALERTTSFLRQSADVEPSDLSVSDFRDLQNFSPSDLGDSEPVASIENVEVGGTACRIYDDDPGSTARPVLLYLHGGAFVRGNLDLADRVCRGIATSSGCPIVSVDYRLAPEHPYPAALNDGTKVLDWISENCQRLGAAPDLIAIGGDSAGATLATVIAAERCDRVRLQFLLCGLYDLHQPITVDARISAHINVAREQRTLDHIRSLYVSEPMSAADRVRVDPGTSTDLSGSPEAVVATSDLDPFAQQSRDYVAALRRDQVPVTSLEIANVPHAFVHFAGAFPEASAVIELVGFRLSSMSVR